MQRTEHIKARFRDGVRLATLQFDGASSAYPSEVKGLVSFYMVWRHAKCRANSPCCSLHCPDGLGLT